jgi:hypothetical protein
MIIYYKNDQWNVILSSLYKLIQKLSSIVYLNYICNELVYLVKYILSSDFLNDSCIITKNLII